MFWKRSGVREEKGKEKMDRKNNTIRKSVLMLKLIEPPGSKVLIFFFLNFLKLGLISYEYDLSLAKWVFSLSHPY